MKKTLIFLSFALISLLSGLFLYNFGPAKVIEGTIYDAMVRYFATSAKISDKLVMVFLDEATMKELPFRSPVPRDLLYELNEKLLAAGTKAIGYDIFFKDPSFQKDDERLAASFKKGNIFAVSAGKIDEAGQWFEDEPLPLFKDALKGIGLSDLPFSSSDSTVRNAQFEFAYSGAVKKSFVAELYNFATGGSAEALIHDPANSFSLLGIGFPPRMGEATRVRYAGPPSKIGREGNPFPTFSAGLVAKGLVPEEWLKDKIVLVGAAYDDGTDAYITPYYSARYNYERMPGVEIHANVLNQLLTKQFYYEMPKSLLIIGLVFLGLFGALLFLYGPLWRGVCALVLLTFLISAKVIIYFHYFGVELPFVPFEGSMLVTFGACLGFRSITEGRQKRFIKGVFAKYVPPSVVEKMIADPKLLKLGGEQKEVTCMFTDIAGFTTISEKLDPQTLVQFLNEYLDRLTRVIFKHGGTLDKYEGDAIISFFGAPLPLADHRMSALLAAIEMQAEGKIVSDKWMERCGREIVTRIGLNSGDVVVGNMGSDLRFDYTAIGDTMNLASRLEGANKFFDTKILASEKVVGDRSKHPILVRPVANVKVKGKTEGIRIYEVLGERSRLDPSIINNADATPEPLEMTELTSK